MAKVTLPDGKVLDIENGLTLYQVAEKIGAGLAKAALAAVVNGQTVDLSTPVTSDINIQIITAKKSRRTRHYPAKLRSRYGRSDLQYLANGTIGLRPDCGRWFLL